MLILLSPTKQMDFSGHPHFTYSPGEPLFPEESVELLNTLRELDEAAIARLMGVSEEIARETAGRFRRFEKADTEEGPALLAYSGTVFLYMNPRGFTESQLAYAEDHVRIISGLYGYLRPSDRIRPYRLEMKTVLANSRGGNLYDFWKEKITSVLAAENRPVLNLASAEYTRVVDFKRLTRPVITVHFREKSGDKLRTVGTYSKMARGMLAGLIIRKELSDPRSIQDLDIKGYRFDGRKSSASEWIYTGNWRM